MLLLDTCVLIYDALDPKRIPPQVREAIDAADQDQALCCSDISLWEIAMLVQRGRLDPGTDALSFIRLALQARGITVLPITPEIAQRSVTITFHGDPADRIIAASAVQHRATLVTPDRKLRQTPEVPTLW